MTILLESGSGLPSKRLRPSKTGSCSLLLRPEPKPRIRRMSKAGASSPEAAPQLSSSAPGCPSSPLLRPRLRPLAPHHPGQLPAGWKCCFARRDRRKSWCARAGTAPTPPLSESITFPHLGLRAMHLCPLQHIWLKVGQQGLFGAHVMKRAQMTELTMEEAERGKEADKAPLTPGEGGVRWQDWVAGGIS